MSSNPMRCTSISGAVVALAVIAAPATWAAEPADAAAQESAPVVVAQASTGVVESGTATEAFPSYQRGVRKAAAEGNEALRRYVWRTRMIYNFHYNDFAPKE